MKRFSVWAIATVALASLSISNLAKAQVGNDNPTGVTGQFSSNSTTGCSYSPYTANATRTVIDITVTGAVGKYPLQWSRTLNTRAGYSYFGSGGGWLHSYVWSVTPHPDMATSIITPTSYDVSYPDGRTITFVPSTKGDTCYMGPAGVADRLQTVHGSGDGYVIFADGGKLKFHQGCVLDPETHWYDYSAKPTAILDPSGLTTTIATDANQNVTQVTEPAGRWLKVTYTSGRISRVDAGYSTNTITQSVTYTYGTRAYGGTNYTVLDSANYITDQTSPSATYAYTVSNTGTGVPLILTCNDIHYPGPMKKIRYLYATNADMPTGMTAVYGQVKTEAYDDGTQNGIAVVTLSVTGASTRTETRGDGTHPTRTFSYGSGSQHGSFSVPKAYLLGDFTDFKGIHTYSGYDSNSYKNNLQDRDGNITSFTCAPYTGNVKVVTHPDPSPSPASTTQYVYTDQNTGYYIDHVIDELGHTAVQNTRDTNMRKTRIDYPDGGFETFTYNSFGEALTHQNTSGGTETSTYDGRGLKQTYRDAYHATGNPSFWYQYDSLDRVSGMTDALGSASGDLNHTTSFTYNNRGRLLTTTHPIDPVDGQRHSITNTYNPEDTLKDATDELGHKTSFTYDDYKRLRTTTTPARFTGDTANHTTTAYYDSLGASEDYTHTDSNVTYLKLPSGKIAATTYDNNFWKASVTVGAGTSDAATSVYGYDNVGNLTSLQSPREQADPTHFPGHTAYTYDSRNRLWKVFDAIGNAPTVYAYDAANRKTSVTRPNTQVITYDSYDNMNRLLQQTVKQTPTADAVTKYTYYTSGLLHTFQDPKLSSGSYNYNYVYDLMGRRTQLTYPPDAGGVQRTESWHYDTAGRNDTFTNRNGNVQTFTYDALNRPTNVAWNDGGVTPTVTFGYDVASRTTGINNANATISRAYFNDNLLNTETTTYADATARMVTYTYDADANRATLLYPNSAYSFTYNYTNRNQLQSIVNNSGPATVVSYVYDRDGNLTTRTPTNSTYSSYRYDELDRVGTISHFLVGTTRTFNYGYDSVSNRTYTQRDGGNGDVFAYDLNDQANGVVLNTSLPTPPATPTPAPATVTYDANGNRLTFGIYGGSTDTYSAANNLNQYTSRNGSASSQYDLKGNMIAPGWDASCSYTYDAQNRLLTATKSGVTDTFKYDGLNRQVSRTVTGSSIVYNVYDGWNLIGEYASGSTTPSNAYLSGAGGLVKSLTNNNFYYQDGSGSTSHLANSSGALQEWYRYDLHGTPIFYNSSNTQISASAYGIRHLFTGQQWYTEIGLYDLRNRFYLPDAGRFLQPDPIRFLGDPKHLYRYCHNNPSTYVDPYGTIWGETPALGGAFAGGVLGTAGGFGYGVSTQIYSWYSGNGWSWSAIGADTGKGALIGIGIGGVVGAVASGDPAAVAEATALSTYTVGMAMATGMAAGAVDYHLNSQPPTPTKPPPAPPNPSLTPEHFDDIKLNLQNFGLQVPGNIFDAAFGPGAQFQYNPFGSFPPAVPQGQVQVGIPAPAAPPPAPPPDTVADPDKDE